MTNWSTTTKHEPSSINNGRRYELRDRVSIEQLNNMTENSFYAMNKASDAIQKAEEALSFAQGSGTTVYENGQPVSTFNADKKANTTDLENYYTKQEIDNIVESGGEQVDLSNYYTKDETYSKEEVDNALSNVEVDLTDYVKTEDFNNLVNNTTQIVATDGGFKAGQANIKGTDAVSIGKNTSSYDYAVGIGSNVSANTYSVAIGARSRANSGGGAVGSNAIADDGGGAIGSNATTSSGFAGGKNAKAEADGFSIDAIQLGTGTNSTEKSLQVYDDNIYNANTHTLTVKNIELNGEPIDSSSSFMPIGSIFASAIPQTDARVHLLDGSTISQTGVYETFANLIKELDSAGQPITCTQEQFDADVSATGNCGKFVIDNSAGTIRLPKITTFIQGLSSITNIGSSLSAGLPNITGGFQARQMGAGNAVACYPDLYNSGAFSYTGNGGATWSNMSASASNTTGANAVINLDASRSSAIYGKSTTVQPNATQYPYYIVLASGYKSSQVVDIDNVMNEINTVRTEIAENEAIKFAESERLKSQNLFDVSKASASRSLFAVWGISLVDILTEEMIGKTICINFNAYCYVIQISNYTYLDAETDTNKIYYISANKSYITFEVTQDLYNNRASRYLNVYSDVIPKGHSNFANLIANYGDKLMVTYGEKPQSYQPYNGEIIHRKDIRGTVLWENPSPSSKFSPQTITLRTNQYDIIDIYFKKTYNEPFLDCKRLLKGYSIDLYYQDGGGNFFFRACSINDDITLTFATAYYMLTTNMGSANTDNGRCVPIRIVGYKEII